MNEETMITVEEYIEALKIVESYHKKLAEEIEAAKCASNTPIQRWDKLSMCSTRLRNGLLSSSYNNRALCIEDFTKKLFFSIRNLGEKTWEEFVHLRGY